MFRFVLSACLALFLPLAQAQFLFQEGRDYHPLLESIDNGTKPKVIEFFWYGCPHCYTVEPRVSEWLKTKPKEIAFERIPAIASERWKPAAEAYYVIEKLGLDAHQRIFSEVHEKNNTVIVFKMDRLQAFLEKEYQVSKEDFEKALNSFSVQQKIKRAENLFNQSKLNGVPSFVVNGRYFVPQQDKNEARFFEQLNQMSRVLP